jgi:hypothetical protein
LKKESLSLEKLSSVVMASLAHSFIFLETKPGNNTGSRNINNNSEPIAIPDILRVLKSIFFMENNQEIKGGNNCKANSNPLKKMGGWKY